MTYVKNSKFESGREYCVCGCDDNLHMTWPLFVVCCDAAAYYGESVGQLSTLHHDVTGNVYIVDTNRIRIVGFFYDGTAPGERYAVTL